ncbi:hypothetical protein [Paenimyroides ceti]
MKFGIDFEIEKIKVQLENKLLWTNKEVYGRVYKNIPKKGKKPVPEVYVRNNEYKEVLTNDLKTATVFFVDYNEHKAIGKNELEAELQIIFIVNLTDLKGNSERIDSEAQHDVMQVLKRIRQYEVSNLIIGLEALKEFDTSKMQTSDMQPWHIFAVKGKIKYNINNC